MEVTASGKVLAGTDYGGMFVSEDAGQTWRQSFLFDCFVNRIRRLDNGILMLSGWKDEFAPNGFSSKYFLMFSADDGATWQNLTATRMITAFARGAGGMLFVGIHGGGVLRSQDGGRSWSAVNNGLQENIGGYLNLYVWDMLDGPDGLLLAATAGGVVKSTDNGNSWARIGPGQQGVRRLYREGQSVLLAACEFGIYRSSDLGISWTGVCPTKYVQGFAKNSRNKMFALSTDGVFVSDDVGLSWARVPMSLTQSTSATTTPDNVFVVATDNNKIFRSTNDGASWSESQTGFTNSSVSSLCVTRSALVAVSDGALTRSTDGGIQWTPQQTPTNITKLVPVGLDTLYALADGIFRSVDEGQSWIKLNASVIQGYPYGIAATRNGHLFVGTATEFVYRSMDAGTSWEVLTPQPPIDRVFLLSANENGLLVVGNGNYSLRASSDNGTSWLTRNMEYANNSIAVNQRGDMFVGDLSGAMVRSADMGASWTKSAITGLYANNVRVLLPLGDHELIAGLIYGGVFRSTDNGLSWAPLNDGLLNRRITSIAVAPDGFGYLGTVGGGAFKSVDRLQ